MSKCSNFRESHKSITSERDERKDCCGSCINEVTQEKDLESNVKGIRCNRPAATSTPSISQYLRRPKFQWLALQSLA
jgi:hypothetical protein